MLTTLSSPTISAKDIKPTDKVFRLKTFQDKFIFSLKRFVAFVGAWGTGKDMASIARGMDLSQKYSNNLGLIARVESTDLRDSTMIDFQDYTGLKIDSDRNVKISNGSKIMFRHLEELTENNLNNMNLGWFCLIQADEIETDSVFFKLVGRLRRQVPFQSGFISANADGEDWISRLFGSPELVIKGSLGDSAELIEARTMDNADVLPASYVDSLEVVKVNKPEMYGRYVLNSRKVSDDKFVVLPYAKVLECVENKPIETTEIRRVTVCDPAEGDFDAESEEDSGEGGGDETVIYDLENGRIIDEEIYRHTSLPDTEARIIVHTKRNNSNVICVDKIGIGAMLYQRLEKTYYEDDNVTVYGFDSRIRAPEGIDDETYANYKTYAWFKARDRYFTDKNISLPKDDILIRQLSKMRYRYTKGHRGGKYQIVPKKEMKRILGCSPDRADALIMGLDALDKAKPVNLSWRGRGMITVTSLVPKPHGVTGYR